MQHIKVRESVVQSLIQWIRRHPAAQAAGIGLACLCWSSCGCDRSDTNQLDAAPSASAASEPTGDGTADQGEVSTAAGGSSIAPDSVNDQGQIVLGGAGVVPAESDGTAASDPSADKLNLPVEANVTSQSEMNQQIAKDWPEPQAVIYVSGQQHGYIEPCGCTGLENQKGGLIRRATLLGQLRERGWELIPVDVGNQVRRIGRQPEIKFQTTVEAFKQMGYRAATLGVDDLKLSSIEVVQVAGSDQRNPGCFLSANVDIIDPSFFPDYRIVEAGGRKIGITGVLGAGGAKDLAGISDVIIEDSVESLKTVVAKLQEENCDFLVLLAHADLDESRALAQQVPDFDIVVTAGGYGEPTLLPEEIDGTDALMVQVGTKGMYGGIIGLFDDEQNPIRYQKIALSAQFEDSPTMLELFAQYQNRLKEAGFEGLGVTPLPHETGREFVGSETCGECHTTAYEIWEGTPHAHATDSIVAANNDRGSIPRHHDPECVSCHATGWKPQEFIPYQTGFISPEQTEHLVGSGCENCHGPGKSHVDAEYGDIDVDNDTLLKLREQMVIKLEDARQKCLECHDLDNSPDFHEAPVDETFQDYWERVKHYGKD